MKSLRSSDETGIKPLVLEEIKDYANKYNLKQVILFGSRARGNYHRASDIDLAVYGGDVTGFTLAVKDETSTLLDFDVIDLGKPVQDKLLQSIKNEGMVLYEKI